MGVVLAGFLGTMGSPDADAGLGFSTYEETT